MSASRSSRNPCGLVAALLVLATQWGTLPAQSVEAGAAPVFTAIEGIWAGEGTLFGRPAVFDMRWERKGSLMVLTFANAMIDSVGRRTPVLDAVALYRTNRDAPRATWEDSRGVQTAITWTADDSSLVADWVASAESGRTSYTLYPDGTLRVGDEVLGPDGLRLFGRATYRRVTR